MTRDLIVVGVLACALTQLGCWFVESVQLHALDELARQATRTDRLAYPRIPAGECPIWDRIRYECEEEYRD